MRMILFDQTRPGKVTLIKPEDHEGAPPWAVCLGDRVFKIVSIFDGDDEATKNVLYRRWRGLGAWLARRRGQVPEAILVRTATGHGHKINYNT